MIIPKELQQYNGIPCQACNEGVLEIVEKDVTLIYLVVYTISVPTIFPKCTKCGAAILPRISHSILRQNKKKVIEKIFYN